MRATAIHTFARNLLVFHGMTQGAAEQVNGLDAAVKLLWKKVPWRSVKGKVGKRALVVYIDEFLSMPLTKDEENAMRVSARRGDKNPITEDYFRGDLIRDLARFSDRSCKTERPVIFM